VNTQIDHNRVFEVLPWLVNGTLTDPELSAVEAHVRDCVTCRIAVREQKRLQTTIRQQPTVPLSADQAFDELMRNVESRRGRPNRSPWLGGLRDRTSVAVAAGLIVAVIGALGFLTRSSNIGERAEYATLSYDARGNAARIDVIFASWVTENDMRELLNEIGATIVGGPSDLGRYTIQLNDDDLTDDDVSKLVERLGDDERVRFAGRNLIEDPP
jgi:hypothetical protein